MANMAPSVLGSLSPAANITGSSVAVPPLPMSLGAQSIGGNTNPFLPVPASGQTVPPVTSTGGGAFPANTPSGGATSPTGLGGTNPYNLFGGDRSQNDLKNAFRQTGTPGAFADLLAEFLRSGAGFNPQVAQALINAMQPQIERGTENIAEQFSALGGRFSSPAAVGLGDFESQVNLNMDQIFAQLYEQSINDYLTILTGAGKKAPTFGSTFGSSLASALGTSVGTLGLNVSSSGAVSGGVGGG